MTRFPLQRGNGMGGAALRYHIARAAFTLTALRGYAELELDVVKAQSRSHMAGNFAVGDPMAYADDHGRGRRAVLMERLCQV